MAAFYYLRLVKTMWFDPAPGETDAPPFEAKWIAAAAAIWAFPLFYLVLGALEPYAGQAARSFGLS